MCFAHVIIDGAAKEKVSDFLILFQKRFLVIICCALTVFHFTG